jgi:hypothetical protein
MAGFALKKSLKPEAIESWTISSQTVLLGDLLMWSAGTATAVVATSAAIAYDVLGVAVEAATTAATSVKVIVVEPGYGQIWEAESASNSSTSDNGDAMVLTDKNTVNNTGTNSVAKEAVFVQDTTAGAAADKRIIGHFAGAHAGLTFNAT